MIEYQFKREAVSKVSLEVKSHEIKKAETLLNQRFCLSFSIQFWLISTFWNSLFHIILVKFHRQWIKKGANNEFVFLYIKLVTTLKINGKMRYSIGMLCNDAKMIDTIQTLSQNGM